MRLFLTLMAVCALSVIPVVASAADQWGPLAPPNPFMAPLGLASMHNDAESSNTEPLAGPGAGLVRSGGYQLLAACPTTVQGRDELVLALCTAVLGEAPTVYLIDPRGVLADPLPLARLRLTKGSLLGGVYAYLDNNDNLVVIDGSNHLFRISHAKDGPLGGWKLSISQSTDLSSAIASGDSSIGLVPDYQGNVWFATANGVVGYRQAVRRRLRFAVARRRTSRQQHFVRTQWPRRGRHHVCALRTDGGRRRQPAGFVARRL